MMLKDIQGKFDVIESFAIARRNEFYLIGQLIEGSMQENWFVNVSFNSTLALCLRIKGIEDIEMASDRSRYKLIIINCDSEFIDGLLALGVGSELVTISIDGED